MSDNPLLVLQQKVSPKPLVEAAKLADAAPLDKHALCLQILQDGYVQSFVDFFYLTHKPDAPAAAAGDDDEQQGDGRFELPADQLEFVRRSLCDAEAARRRSETKEVFASYQALAALFASMDDYKTSVYFREKCLEIARLVADTEGELVASRELGVAHEQLGHKLESIQFFEKAHQLARGNPEQGARSNRDLVLVRAGARNSSRRARRAVLLRRLLTRRSPDARGRARARRARARARPTARTPSSSRPTATRRLRSATTSAACRARTSRRTAA